MIGSAAPLLERRARRAAGAACVGAAALLAGCSEPVGFVAPDGEAPPREAVVVRGDIEYRAVLVTARLDGVDAQVTLTNRGRETRTLVFPHTCGALLRAYHARGGRLAWDQAEGKIQCAIRPFEVALAPGESRVFRPGAGALAVLGLATPSGRFEIAAYLTPDGEDEVELHLGEVELEAPEF